MINRLAVSPELFCRPRVACAPTGEQAQLVLCAAAGFGGVGDQRQPFAREPQGVAGEFDLADERIAQGLAGSAVEADIMPGPSGRELGTAGGQIADEAVQGARSRGLRPDSVRSPAARSSSSTGGRGSTVGRASSPKGLPPSGKENRSDF